jgi:predicted nucleotidyltransferase
MIEISDSELISFFHRPEAKCKGYVVKIICLKLQNIICRNHQNLDRRCPSGREGFCPNRQHPLGRQVEDYLRQLTTLLGGLDLPEKS